LRFQIAAKAFNFLPTWLYCCCGCQLIQTHQAVEMIFFYGVDHLLSEGLYGSTQGFYRSICFYSTSTSFSSLNIKRWTISKPRNLKRFSVLDPSFWLF